VTLPTDLIANPDVVLLDLRAGSREEAIRLLHAPLAKLPAVRDADLFLHGLLERAQLASVCIAEDVALPHARTAAVDRVVFAVGRTAAGVAFDAEHPAVRLVFLIGTPKEAVTEYLRTVAALSRLLKTEGVRAGLLAARTEAEFRGWLQPAAGSGAAKARGAGGRP
jgi:mannitol/fructose-specific phosphotransferase system IIA component (Ntr-type)